MHVLSVNVGQVEEIAWRGRVYRTAFRKRPVAGTSEIGPLGVSGDIQADPEVHGGPDKAVYLYPFEHYPLWAERLAGGHDLPYGALGENLTTRGLLESDVAIGDIFEVGSALLQVTQPRLPCVKLAAAYRQVGLPRAFAGQGLPGVYFRVLRPGSVAAGDEIRVIQQAVERWTPSRVFHALVASDHDQGEILRLAGLETLGAGARRDFQESTGFRGVIRTAYPHDVAVLLRMLRLAGLPDQRVVEDAAVILAAVDSSGALLGGVAVEVWGTAALIRSLVVQREARGRGMARALAKAAIAQARGRGAISVGLLTETAGRFFPRLGFDPVPRGQLPAELNRSVELQGACPDSAQAFLLRD